MGTAESDDYDIALWTTDPDFSFVFDPGATTDTVTIEASQDADTDHETFTVALGTLPAGVAAGAVTSLDFTITDDDATTQPPSGGFWSATLTVDESGGDFGLSFRPRRS